MKLRFTKMQGIGNDFVMVDAISQSINMTPERARVLADRRFGVGCDQVLVVEPPSMTEADFRYRIFNNDGLEVENCGNGARCFALFVRMRRLTGKSSIKAETAAGILTLTIVNSNTVSVNMGTPILLPSGIPFHANERANIYPLQLAYKGCANHTVELSAVSMGNPHAVLVVDDIEHCGIEELGPTIESHPRFPNNVNVGFMQILNPTEINLRVFERGVGETLACGTGACAAVVGGRLRELLHNDKIKVNLPGGSLSITWPGENSPVTMTGPANTVFHGQVKIP